MFDDDDDHKKFAPLLGTLDAFTHTESAFRLFFFRVLRDDTTKIYFYRLTIALYEQ